MTGVSALLMFVALILFGVAIFESQGKNWVAWGLAFMALALGAQPVLKALF